MYQNHEHLFYYNPYGQEDYLKPYRSENYYPESFGERQFGQWSPFSGAPMGPPPGPPGQGPEVGPPTTAPPSFVPAESQQAVAFAVDPGSIRGCLFRFTYLWLRNRQQFWYFPIFVGRSSTSGYRWDGFRWVFFGVSLREIRSFTCV
ncbi:hypothetical protein [Salipaludibacillus daqingensis]|uniref:hypothetical protein n=1 Tax=Salipaludibacillus daqingensis TaxID=3041001 RepID=UPI002473E17B|nr:hypothetical protein [Salipaludibacillus daqingensis]